MTKYKTINKDTFEGTLELPYQAAHELFSKIYNNHEHKFLFESKDISHIYGRLSLTGIDPALKITGKDTKFEITSLNDRGKKYLENITDKDLSICDTFEKKTKRLL